LPGKKLPAVVLPVWEKTENSGKERETGLMNPGCAVRDYKRGNDIELLTAARLTKKGR